VARQEADRASLHSPVLKGPRRWAWLTATGLLGVQDGFQDFLNDGESATKRISLEQVRKVVGLESVRDAAGNIIREAPLPAWANLRQRALNTAIKEINSPRELNISPLLKDRMFTSL
jgi:hypothetical protein